MVVILVCLLIICFIMFLRMEKLVIILMLLCVEVGRVENISDVVVMFVIRDFMKFIEVFF